jgi:hypothetical protein
MPFPLGRVLAEGKSVKVEQDLLLDVAILILVKYLKWRAWNQGMRLVIRVKMAFHGDSPSDRKPWS